MRSKNEIFKIGIKDVAPHLLSVFPFGIIFGAIGIELGFSPLFTYATSLIIFGGASQIVFLQLLSGGASSLIAITSVGVINSRHFLYGAVLSEYLQKLSLIKKLFISYFIVDQGFAVSDIGMGSAVSLVIVLLLLSFMVIYFRLIGKRMLKL